MPLLVENRIVRLRMGLVSLRQQHGCAQKDRLPPELGQQPALDFEVLYVSCARGERYWRYGIAQLQANAVSAEWIQMNVLRHAVQVARRTVELLAFPLVLMGPDNAVI